MANYTLSGAGMGTLNLAGVSVNAATPTTYDLTLSGLVNNGSIIITLNSIADTAGNALANNTLTLNGTTTNPTATFSPVGGLRNAMNLITVTYDKPVLNANLPSSYTLGGTGTGTLAVASVAAGFAADSYDLTLSGTPVDGTVIVGVTGVTDLVGNQVQGASINYTLDMTPPTITLATPADGAIMNGLGTGSLNTSISLTYSETVAGAATLVNYALSGTGVGTLAVASVSSMGNTYQLNLTGSAVAGTVTLTVSGANIKDNALNALSGAMVYNYTIDKNQPTISGIAPVPDSKIKALPNLAITFSEAMLNATDPTKYQVVGNSKGTLAATSVTANGGNSYTVAFSGAPAEQATWKDMGIQVWATDLAGNIPAGGQINYVVDQTPPVMTAGAPDTAIQYTTLASVDVAYSEVITGANLPASYTLSGTGAGTMSVLTTANPMGNTYTLFLAGTPGVGPLTITSTAVDAAGNITTGSITYNMVLGATITAKTSNVTGNLFSIAANGATMIAIPTNTSILSKSVDNGATWAATTVNCGSAWRNIMFVGTQWIMLSTNVATSIDSTCTSPDGINWTLNAASTLTTTSVRFAGLLHDGTNYVAVGLNPAGVAANSNTCLFSTSANGATWPAATYCNNYFNGLPAYLTATTVPDDIYFLNGLYFITGSNSLFGPVLSKNTVLNSTSLWTSVGIPLNSARKVIHNGTKYLVAGSIPVTTTAGGAGIVTSADMVTWSTFNTKGTNDFFMDVAFNGTSYIAVGSPGIIFTSTDGLVWTKQVSGTTATLTKAIWDATSLYWVVVGSGGTILTVKP